MAKRAIVYNYFITKHATQLQISLFSQEFSIFMMLLPITYSHSIENAPRQFGKFFIFVSPALYEVVNVLNILFWSNKLNRKEYICKAIGIIRGTILFRLFFFWILRHRSIQIRIQKKVIICNNAHEKIFCIGDASRIKKYGIEYEKQ